MKGVIDGRNRLAACRLAGVEPQFTRLNGEDKTAFIVSVNINRRSLTKGQRTMALAVLYPEAAKYRRGGNPLEIKGLGVNQGRLSQARLVLRETSELAKAVLGGTVTLDAAYETAKDARDKREGRNTQVSEADRELAELRESYPDLADRVRDEEITLAQAKEEAEERDKHEFSLRQAICQAAANGLNLSFFAGSASKDFMARIEDEEFRDMFRQYTGVRPRDLGPRIAKMKDGFEALSRVLAAWKESK